MGGASVPITVNTTEVTVIDNPTFALLDGSGTTSDSPIYGSFANPTFDGVFDFATTLASVGVRRVQTGVYEVSTAGDYLVSYNLGVYDPLVFEVLNNQNQVVNFISFDRG